MLVGVAEGIGELGWLDAEGDDGRGQPIPSPSKPLHCVEVAPEVVGELEGASTLRIGDDGSGQPIPSPNKPLH